MKRKFDATEGGGKGYSEAVPTSEVIRLYNQDYDSAATIYEALITRDTVAKLLKSILKTVSSWSADNAVIKVQCIPGGTGTAVDVLSVTVAQSGAAAGDVDTDEDAEMIVFESGDLLRVAVTTAGTATDIKGTIAVELGYV